MVIQQDGAGRLYYRLGMSYAPRSRHLEALNQGFELKRTFHALDDPDDVRQVEGGWEIRAGARVQVQLTLIASGRHNYVALTDWLPAGLEVINPALGDGSEAGSWRWYNYQNLRDRRVEVFFNRMDRQVYTYRYLARATTTGEFVAPPAKAEEMYRPEVFGRTASEVVRVLAPKDPISRSSNPAVGEQAR